VDETPVNAKDKSITLLIVPTEVVDDTPVNETVSSAKFPHSPSFHAFAPQPVARTASRFQYAWPQVNRPHPDWSSYANLMIAFVASAVGN
jgi:hypothetical protein